MKKKKITKDMRINEVLEKNEQAAEILFEAGLTCIGCPMSMMETVEQGLMAHGRSEEEVDELIEELNK